MIIYGSRMYGKRDVVEGFGYCDSCGVYGQRQSYSARKWGHLYFIPLIPSGPPVRVINECGKCSQGAHLPEKEVPNMLAGLCLSRDNALAALLEGKKEFNNDGEMAPCIPVLTNAIELLYCLHCEDHAPPVLEVLQQRGRTYAYHVVRGESQEFHGRRAEAAESYRLATQCEPSETYPLLLLGCIDLGNGDFEAAKRIYEKALGLSDNKLPVLEILLTVYEGLGDYEQLSGTYEECFRLAPELSRDKKTVKGYKKACKNAGRQPMMM